MKLWRKPFDVEEKSTKPGQVTINKEKCKGCGYCVEFCPRKTLKMSQEISAKGYLVAAVDDPSQCLNCGLCEIMCPEFAVRLVTKDSAKQN